MENIGTTLMVVFGLWAGWQYRDKLLAIVKPLLSGVAAAPADSRDEAIQAGVTLVDYFREAGDKPSEDAAAALVGKALSAGKK